MDRYLKSGKKAKVLRSDDMELYLPTLPWRRRLRIDFDMWFIHAKSVINRFFKK